MMISYQELVRTFPNVILSLASAYQYTGISIPSWRTSARAGANICRAKNTPLHAQKWSLLHRQTISKTAHTRFNHDPLRYGLIKPVRYERRWSLLLAQAIPRNPGNKLVGLDDAAFCCCQRYYSSVICTPGNWPDLPWVNSHVRLTYGEKGRICKLKIPSKHRHFWYWPVGHWYRYIKFAIAYLITKAADSWQILHFN